MPPTPTIAGPGWLENWLAGRADCANALSCFDALAGVDPGIHDRAMAGRRIADGTSAGWRAGGAGLVWKGVREPWKVHPLLFRARSGAVVPLDPAFMPVRVALRWPALAKSAPVRVAFAVVRPLLHSDHSAARLRAVDFRGKRSAATVYDRQPIVDHFRRIDDDRVLGLMEMRRMERPFFFLLTRDQTLRASEN